MQRLEYRLLGPLEVTEGDQPLSLGRRQQRAVLALLLLHLNSSVSTDQLVEALWPDKPPGKPHTAIQGYVSRLRKLLGAETIETAGGGYALHADPEQLDAHRFEQLLRAGQEDLARHPRTAAEKLDQALELWRGPALAEFTYEAWAQEEIARLEELRLVTREHAIEARLALGHHAELVPELEKLISQNPLRERPRSQLMLALYRRGRQAEALEAYQQARRALVDELGIDPSPTLQDLNRKILNQDPELAEQHAGQPKTNLPAPATPIVGRQEELEQLRGFVLQGGVRLVTITGPGGTGKTRLALELGRQVESEFDDGVFAVELAGLTDWTLVSPTVARALGISETPGEPIEKTLQTALAGRNVLLLLDNFEHVLPAAADVAALLAAAPRLSVLATSRSPLSLASEHEFELSPLPLGAAVELFVERARAVKADFEVTPDNAAVVEEVCSRLEGLPLAIELAAVRTKTLTPEALLERLDRRLEVLTGGRRDAPERQRTLRAAIDWSYELLDEDSRQLLARLSVFAGGWTLEAAEQICDADLDGLTSLVDNSLVRARGNRFELLEMIREFAFERLEQSGEAGAVLERHAAYFAELAKRAAPELESTARRAWLERLEADHDNLRGALEWTLGAGDSTAALQLSERLYPFWSSRGHMREAMSACRRSLEIAEGEERPERVTVLCALGELSGFSGDLAGARVDLQEAITFAERTGDRLGLARALHELALVEIREDDVAAGAALLEQSLEAHRSLDDSGGIASTLNDLAYVALLSGETSRAVELLEESLGLAREAGAAMTVAQVLHSLGHAELQRADPDRAEEFFGKCLVLQLELGERFRMIDVLQGLAEAAVAAGDDVRAAQLFGTEEALRTEVGRVLSAEERPAYEQALAELQSRLDAVEFERAWRKGRELPLTDLAAYAAKIA